jgi:signal transduction histidine kinase
MVRVIAVGVVAAVLGAALTPETTHWSSVLSCSAAGLAGLLAVARARGRMRIAWVLLAVPFWMYAAGDALWVLHDQGGDPVVASTADLLYGLALLPLVAGVLVYPVLEGTRGRRRLVALDAVVMVLAVTSLCHTLALSEVLLTATSTSQALMLSVYPWADALLASLALVALLRTSGRPRPDVLLIGATFLAYTVADAGFALLTVRGAGATQGWIDLLYTLAPLPVAAAALLAAYTPTVRRPMVRRTGLVAPLIPDVTALLALTLALLLTPADALSRVLVLLVLLATGVRLVAQTASSQRLQAQLELRVVERSREMAELAAHHQRLDEQQSQFVSSVSHELRTPLTAIRGSLELLHDGDAGELPREALSVVTMAVRGTERLGRLVDDIIDLERLQGGAFGLSVTPTALGPLVEHAVALLAPLAEEQGVTLVDRLPADATWVAGDADRLVQVLVNLMGNALKYAPAGTEVTVRVEVVDGEARVSVADRGRGIPEEDLEHVFARFHQVAPADDRRRGGTGLGLTICQAIVSAHDGRIWAGNDEGAVFTFTLPLAVPAPAVEQRVPHASADAPRPR